MIPCCAKKESQAPSLRNPWREPTGGSPVAVKGPLFTATGLSQKGKVQHQQSSIHLLSLLILHSGWQGYWSLSQLSWGEGGVTTWTSLLRYLRAICNHVRFICCFWAACSPACWMCQSWKHICVVFVCASCHWFSEIFHTWFVAPSFDLVERQIFLRLDEHSVPSRRSCVLCNHVKWNLNRFIETTC